MADTIRINTDRLGIDAERIRGMIQSITKGMDEIRQSAAALETMWEGAGSDAFNKTFWDDMQTVAAAVQEMEQIYDYDANAKKQYEQCERKVASLIAEIRV